MTYSVQYLIEGHGEPICASPDDQAQKALNLMIEHGFSQLPVIDVEQRPVGLVTHQSILRAHASFGLPVDQFLVADAIVKIAKSDIYNPEDDLFELLDRLRDTSAVLIVDREVKLIGIVTSYDAMEYFRRRAEDMMLVEDIESMVKDLAQAAFTDENGEIAEADVQRAIEEITSSQRALRGRYRSALREYLKLQGQGKSEINQQWLEGSFSHLTRREKPKSFEELTLYEYTELLLHKSRWDFYRPFFNLEPEAVRKMLTGVREMRNALAHFRAEISPAQRKQLRFCSGWLKNHQIGILVSWPTPSVGKPQEQLIFREKGSVYETSAKLNVDIIPTEEELDPNDSRYAPLAIWLQSKSSSRDRVQLTFQDVEDIIGAELPRSAREHRAWWANDTVGHSQSQQWLEAGWRVARIDMTGRKVTFARIKQREEAYIDFFSTLQADLSQYRDFPSERLAKTLGPDGQSWQTVATLPEGGPQAFYFVFNFTRLKRFRVELYIDTADQSKNKRVFDLLHARKDHFEAALGEELGWERLDQNRASRIAVYRPSFITDGEEQLAQLRTWAVDTKLRFYQVFAEPASQALASVEQSGE